MEGNIYDNPEKFGLTILGTLDGSPDESYEFNYLVVWQDKTGTLYFAHDSGCSCPTPFEDLSLEKLAPLNNWTFSAFTAQIKSMTDARPVESAGFLARMTALVYPPQPRRPMPSIASRGSL